ncbi:Transcriptional regulatory protein ZraR [Rubripirellula obstinata]|uniref:Transcriptional regulatory protein ZraR n=1 Tax=Rubripirellula obstinata TaxID=406547 RepID=A0A5B1CK94_9BACT|nr:sigma-54 dependent transcriptional regulator [Rubripirellula obstinata]KAA1260732.1 Transcriptional regulatory protein ZraR [Rubripirellula obstinata]
MTARILIADDEPLYLRTTGDLLRKAGYECVCVADAHQAIEMLRDQQFDLVLSDLKMPGNLKLELLHEHAKLRQRIPIIVITGVPTLPSAIESIRLGITDYLLKPVKFEILLASVQRALANPSIVRAADVPMRKANEWASVFPDMIGNSPPMLEVFEIVERVASTDTNILITGESGTGKEVVAKTIHEHSHRSGGVFQVIDCTAVPEALFESILFGHKKGAFTGAASDQPGLLKQCDDGTAFLDELGELPLLMQAKLLRAVQEKEFTPLGGHRPVTVNTRFVCATNRDLKMEVSAGRFRQDLFYRLGVIHIDLPPLRKRDEDVVMLAEHFLKTLRPTGSPVKGFSADALEVIRRYRWPGNIRELRNVIEGTIALTQRDVIEAADLPAIVRQQENDPAREPGDQVQANDDDPTSLNLGTIHPGKLSRDEALRAAEHQYLIGLLDVHDGNVSEAARQAGLSRQGLHKLLKTHNIQASDFR